MADKMGDILNRTQELIAVKRAEFKNTLTDGDTEKEAKGTEGAANAPNTGKDDSPKTRGHALEADQSALEPTKEPALSADANAEPSSGGAGTDGSANGPNSGKDDSPLTRGHALEADEPSITEDKQPLITDDANAEPKSAAANLANDILSSIRDYQKEADVKEEAPVKEAAAKEEAPVKEAAEKAEKCECGKESCDCKEKKSEEGAPSAEAKEAGGLELELTTDVLAKIAAMMLSTEEGADAVETLLAKEAGAEDARETLAFLAEQSEFAEKQAAYDAGSQDAEALIQQSIFNAGYEQAQKEATAGAEKVIYKNTSAADEAPVAKEVEAPATDKTAAAKAQAKHDWYAKLGQAVADASIEDLMGEAGGAGAPMDVPPEALAGGEAGLGEEGMGLPGEEAMGGEMGGEEGISEEELQGALDELVAEGTIGPEEAQQVLEFIAQAGGEEGMEAPEGVPGEEAPMEEAPMEEAPAEEAPAEEAPPAEGEGYEEKMSADVKSLMDTIRQIKAQK